MSFHSYLEKKQAIQNALLEYIEKSDNVEENYQNFITIINDQKIKEDPIELKSLFHLILKISKHHYRTQDFFAKIEKILQNFSNEIKTNHSNFEIFNIFKGNKRILLYLIKNDLLKIDKTIAQIMTENNKYIEANYPQYFYPEIKQFIGDKYKTEITDDFEEKRSQGENDDYICGLIRKDSIDEFISYVNEKSLPLQSTIEPSIFETNPLLIRKVQEKGRNNFRNNYFYRNQKTDDQIKLIDYAAFFGSGQIFKYLFLNKAEVSQSIWTFVVHGENQEIISFLETNNMKPKPDTYKKCFYESIKCFHNDISNYIQNNYLQSYQHSNEVIKYYNFAYIKSEFIDKTVFFDLCRYDFAYFVKEVLENSSVDVNTKTILIIYFCSFNYKLICFNIICKCSFFNKISISRFQSSFIFI